MPRIKRKFESFKTYYLIYGFTGVISRLWIRLFFFFKGADFLRIKLEEINEIVPNKANGNMFSTTTFHGLKISLEKLNILNQDIYNGTFVDFGSDKGLTLYTAYK